MNPTKRHILFFVLTAFATIVCRCSNGPLWASSRGFEIYDREDNLWSQGPKVGYCYDLTGSGDLGWNCSLTCPDSSEVNFHLPSDADVKWSTDSLNASEVIEYCSIELVATSTPLPTFVSTLTLTATSTSTLTPLPSASTLKPLLAGNVSACDTALGFINFPIAQPQELSGKEVHEVFINGNKVRCHVAGSQKQVLSCNLPAGATFPIVVSVSLQDTEVNNFSFDGAICTETLPTKEPKEGDPVAPTATPVDCSVDPYHPDC